MIDGLPLFEWASTTFDYGECFECCAVGPVHEHHVVPRIVGGTRTVPLCEKCHGLVHGVSFGSGGISHSRLVRIGLEKRKASGVKLGRPFGSEKPDVFLAKHERVIEFLQLGTMSIRQIARECSISTGTVVKVKKYLSPGGTVTTNTGENAIPGVAAPMDDCEFRLCAIYLEEGDLPGFTEPASN